MHYRQFLQPRTGCASYLLGCNQAGAAVVIDPVGPVEPFLQIGRIHLRVLHTPGHTPDSLSLVVEDRGRVSEPWFVLTGDTLLVGDVGRPDLTLNDEASVLEQARALHTSLFDKILPLGDALEIHPAHFGSSPCGGQNMSRKPFSTIGFERRFNLALQLPTPEAFGRFVLSTLRPQPENFRGIKQENLGWARESIARAG